MPVLLLLLLLGILPAADPAEPLDVGRALRDPAWGWTAVTAADPAFAAAVAAARAGDTAPLAAWTRAADLDRRDLAAQVAMGQSDLPGADAHALHPLFEGLLAGVPADEPLRRALANHLAYSLVARPVPPTPAELARAGELADELEPALARPEVARGRNGHGIADTVACVRFLQGDRARAAGLWRRAIALSGPGMGGLYRRRLAAAESAEAPLPR